MRDKRTLRRVAMATGIGLVAGLGITAGFGLPAYAGGGHSGGHGGGHGPGKGNSSLADAVKADAIVAHLDALQAIADANDGTRAAGSAGHIAAAEYIEQQLRDAGYDPVRQPFSYDQFVENSSAFEQLTPTATSYVDQTDYDVMDYSGSGDVSAVVTPVDINLAGDRASTSGCEAEDFAGFTAGEIALLQRGTCDFRTKIDNAAAAGAAAAIVFNQGNVVEGDDRLGLVLGTLATPQAAIPAIGTTFAIGEGFAATETTLRIQVDGTTQAIETFNVLADAPAKTKGKHSAPEIVVVGGHLDSVAEGPGINDNGSGSGAILETAIQLAKSKLKPQNTVRFAFWSGEEDGLVGSAYYVSQLTDADIAQHAVNLNFDMVASPNFVRFVYDGDGSAFGSEGPEGSAEVEQLFTKFFAKQGLATEETAFDGRSDYNAFIEAGIPAGGLFTGAEGVKSDEQAAVFGGTAGEPFDPCYHQACDTSANINVDVLDEMADGIAYATQHYADVKAGKGHGHGHGHGHGDSDNRGHHSRR
ncbi:Zn-dependent M28 family amino/carboxypeptidase [Homoserinimonas aerilata]|uniref:Zn-dependent M28 family amino/carboxypeptidase n=1 Tax=Homoserinimonas aerilata TaxID=1162970 RepID=A0A542YJ18_9MICO|nr:M20/M25/M40 family metallo-hydrolase [Homoserinimonas aerilata]TQL48083.1 Zn-dependent M28 family amino/carboxypeptidase [Homoserinimonas aerilata]